MSASRIPALDGVRAVACLAVMAFHAHIPGAGYGWAGVDVFFVLSGYLTATQLGDGRPAGRWLYRRWARLHPAILAVVAVVGPLAVVGGAAPVVVVGVAGFVYVPWFTGGDGGLLGHTWTITVEVAGYVAAAVLLPRVLRFPRAVVVVVFAGLAVACYLAPWDAVRLVRPEGILLGWAIGTLPTLRIPSALQRAVRPLEGRAMTWVGARTYSLYLWHLPLFLTLRFHTPLTGVTLTVVQFAAAFTAAAASYRWVERPARTYLTQRVPGRAPALAKVTA